VAAGQPIGAVSRDDRERELRVLYEIIHTVNSTLDLERVLSAIVRLVNDAIVAHATYVFLAEEGGRRLVLRAASERYAQLCGRVSMEAGEGIAGWVLQNRQPVFIPENVLADPRIKYFPELEEEKYQSLVSVPLVIKGERVIGVIALHAEAPRVFSSEDAAFLIHCAELVASAIENARLYERTRRALRELEQLSRMGARVAAAESVDDLLATAVEQARELLRAESVRIYLLDPGGDRLSLRAGSPDGGGGPALVSLPELGVELRRGGVGGASLKSVLAGTLWGVPEMRSALVAPLIAGDEVLGFLVARLDDARRTREHDRDLANSIASQTAIGLNRLHLTERLAERNLIKDVFDELERGTLGGVLAERARRLGIDLDAPGVMLCTLPARGEAGAGFAEAAEALESALSRALPGAAADRREGQLRVLVPLGVMGEEAVIARLDALVAQGPPGIVAGVSSAFAGPAAATAALAEARQAAIAAPVMRSDTPVVRYEALGLYKYLLRVPLDERVRDRHSDALRRLREHDRRRRSQLLPTLEEFLGQRGNMAATAKALYVHPNTLRQRLRRIATVTGLDPKSDDWLMMEIACKLIQLEEVYPSEAPA
jgi:GAF domain-containing protein